MHDTSELLAAIDAGEMVVVLDDEDRENEGDLIMAADKVRPEDINFMARHARGLICLALTQERCRKLNLPLMVTDNQSTYTTAFTVSIEAAEGVTTGISAYDRAHTVRTAVAADARPGDLAQPGHIFPLMARPGGVLTRAGHTEAGVDLALLAGSEPAAVLVEILNDDGSMARRPELESFARRHGLKMGTIADLIRYRMETEKTVVQMASRSVQTRFGPFELVAFRDVISKRLHLALVRGVLSAEEETTVRVHLQSTLSDLLGVRERGLGLPLDVALEQLARCERGVLVLLNEAEDDEHLLDQVRVPAFAPETERAQDLRTYGVGAQILAELGVGRMRVLSAPKRFHGLAGFGLEVTEYVDLEHSESRPERA